MGCQSQKVLKPIHKYRHTLLFGTYGYVSEVLATEGSYVMEEARLLK
jgi:hypothetical protein